MSCSEMHELEEVDVVAVSPPPVVFDENNGEKKYFCQRCLNHGEYHPRKGHKPVCQYTNCTCENCSMVETRRQLNNKLKNPPIPGGKEKKAGPKSRNPNCARCQAHGVVQQLKGHKKSQCEFAECTCEKCQLVCIRRNVMAQQIKLRRNQKRARLCGTGRQSTESSDGHTSDSGSPSPAPPTLPPSFQMPSFPIQPMPMRPPLVPHVALQPLMMNAAMNAAQTMPIPLAKMQMWEMTVQFAQLAQNLLETQRRLILGMDGI